METISVKYIYLILITTTVFICVIYVNTIGITNKIKIYYSMDIINIFTSNESSLKRYQDINLTHPSISAKSKIKHILHWGDSWGEPLCIGYNFQDCPVQRCYATRETRLMPLESYDAIIFFDVWDGFTKPENRNMAQKYILYSAETPVKLSASYRNDFFNWTISYRKDADIYFPFGSYEKKVHADNIVTWNQVQHKSKSVAWLVSNCNSPGVEYRLRYVRELRKYIKVDTYGKCGIPCPGLMMSLECYDLLDKKYKFYLAFENSFCKDYISEKPYNILRYTNMIPVVSGYVNYTKHLPPNSYIDAEDFKSPKHLAKYLLYLEMNKEEYMKYFEWRKFYDIKAMFDIRPNVCCELCKKLHEPIEYSWHKDLHEWAWGKEKSYCYTGKKFRYKGEETTLYNK